MRKLVPLLCMIALPLWAQEVKKVEAPPPAPSPAPAVVPENAPQAVVANETFDAGEVIRGKKIEHSFIVKNAGKSELEILSAKPG
jgi:hypothetical protein